jgi:hypothetical protein
MSAPAAEPLPALLTGGCAAPGFTPAERALPMLGEEAAPGVALGLVLSAAVVSCESVVAQP